MISTQFETFACNGESHECVGLESLLRRHDRDIHRYPFAIRVMIENVARHMADFGSAGAHGDDLAALLDWNVSRGYGVPLHVSRVIMPDSSGLPVLLDLAALRDAVTAAGGDGAVVDAQVPVDLIVDHSLQVDQAGSPEAMDANLRREFARNEERYRFLKWAQQAFSALRVFPPGSGIIHQINLEYLAQVITTARTSRGALAFPEFVIGGDSHTPMMNALGVLGWGVGGLEIEGALLGQPYVFPIPEVVGVRLAGTPPSGVLTTDIALLLTQRLRATGVIGCILEFFGPGVDTLALTERATLANMSPEYGATAGFFPVDQRTLAYLASSGRDSAQCALVEAYCRFNALLRDESTPIPDYSRIIEVDLGDARLSVAGPRRPQDRLAIGDVAPDFRRRLATLVSEGGWRKADARAVVHSSDAADRPALLEPTLSDGAIVIAALTSCSNTANPRVMVAAGLVARNAVAAGLAPPSWVKTSLAPGSRVTTRQLEQAGLLNPLEHLGFHVVGYGCTTCGGKSGPLAADVVDAITRGNRVVAAVLSGNRNFEGRIHRLVRANYIGSPALVVVYALAGTVDIDLEHHALGHDASGRPVFMRDLWPSDADIDAAVTASQNRNLFIDVYADRASGFDAWSALEAPVGPRYRWDADSRYLVRPPFFDAPDASTTDTLPDCVTGARVLVAFGDSLTTDHISPGGEIPLDSAAGRYLTAAGIAQSSFNTYVGRRCNHEVMIRATFANLRVRNELVPGVEGGITRHFPSDDQLPVHQAAAIYRHDGVPMIVIAGKEYGTGSSRDWAAKGTALLGVCGVIAESFERIHLANLVAMGVLPLQFRPGQGWRSLGLTGTESFTLSSIHEAVDSGAAVILQARDGAHVVTCTLDLRISTETERLQLREGGIFKSMLGRALDRTAAPAEPSMH